MRVVPRKIFFWTHLAVGIVAAALLLVMTITGALMTWEKQIIAGVDRWGVTSHPATAGAQPLPVETLIAQAQRTRGVDPEYITVFAGKTQPAEVYLNRELGSYYVDAYSGAVIGEPSPKTHTFFARVRAWHRWLGVARPSRATFRGLIGAANAMLLFLAVFGVYLWLPRRWTWKHIRAVLVLRLGLTGRAKDFNWHNAIGFWAVLPLLVIVWTGMAMSYSWAKRLTYQAAGTPLHERKEGAEPQAVAGEEPVTSAEARFSGLSALLARAKQQSADWKAITLEVPDKGSDPVTFTLDMSGYEAVGKSAELELDRSGRVNSFTPAGEGGLSARTFIRYGHTGEAWGVAGQTIAGATSVGGAFLVWTGIALSLRRLKSWRVRRAKARTAVHTLRSLDHSRAA
ncbi:MAG TPA: PepSY-associated TM helix domain-containing protein [Bryobacteraceae bacterium]|nr:PepSY-associated TM helix domain-containing protein [Bryobacteraceae bacterium]